MSMRPLHPGSLWSGSQASHAESYVVNVRVVACDLDNDRIDGFLRITGLIEDCEHIETYFEGEVIGSKHSFFTRKWGASDEDDLTAWNTFPQFRAIADHIYDADCHKYINPNIIFMRWKEKFLLSDPSLKLLPGASFDGFYYIVLDLSHESAPLSPVKSPRTKSLSPKRSPIASPIMLRRHSSSHSSASYAQAVRGRSLSEDGRVSPTLSDADSTKSDLSIFTSVDPFEFPVPYSPRSPTPVSFPKSHTKSSTTTLPLSHPTPTPVSTGVTATLTGYYFQNSQEPGQKLSLVYQGHGGVSPDKKPESSGAFGFL